MTTDTEAAVDLYEQLKPGALQAARKYVLSRTPSHLQAEVIAEFEEDLENAIAETDPPTVVDAPLIWQETTILKCTLGNWTGSPNTRTYQWQRDGADVVGADEATYTIVAGTDVNHLFTCIMTATNASGTSAPVTSNQITVAPLP